MPFFPIFPIRRKRKDGGVEQFKSLVDEVNRKANIQGAYDFSASSNSGKWNSANNELLNLVQDNRKAFAIYKFLIGDVETFKEIVDFLNEKGIEIPYTDRMRRSDETMTAAERKSAIDSYNNSVESKVEDKVQVEKDILSENNLQDETEYTPQELIEKYPLTGVQKIIWDLIKDIVNKLGIKVKFSSSRITEGFDGSNNPQNGEILIRPSTLKNGRFGEVLVHEVVHALTTKIISRVNLGVTTGLTQKQINAVKGLMKLYEAVKADNNLKNKYPVKDVFEFIAHLTNEEFVKELESKDKNFLQKVVDFILDILGITNANELSKKYLLDIISDGVFLQENGITVLPSDYGSDIQGSLSDFISQKSHKSDIKPGVSIGVKITETDSIENSIPNKTSLELLGKTKSQIVNQIKKFFTDTVKGINSEQAQKLADANFTVWEAVAKTISGAKGTQAAIAYMMSKVAQIGIISSAGEARAMGSSKFQKITPQMANRIVNNAIEHLKEPNKKGLEVLRAEKDPKKRNDIKKTIQENNKTIAHLVKVKKDPKFSVESYNENVEVVNGFYSPIERNLIEYGKDKIKAKDWLNVVGKGDEAVFTGVRAFLEGKDQNAMVSKQEILDYMKDNRISVVEVVKGAKQKLSQEAMADVYNNINEQLSRTNQPQEIKDFVEEKLNNWYNNPSDANYKTLYNVLGEANMNLDDFIDDAESRMDDTRFSQYQLEGEKENYKEVLVTLPDKKKQVFGEMSSTLDYAKDTYGINSGEYRAVKRSLENQLEDDYGFSYTQIKELFDEYEKSPAIFKSTHFDEPNILVHLRMNTRTDADGKKVLFLEEVQSDFAKSYRTDMTNLIDFVNKNEEYVIEMYKKSGKLKVEC
jgi:hypothetical protein